MNQDPLDSLQSFYKDCQSAPLPPSLTAPHKPAPWWMRALLPIGGLSLGGVLALLIVIFPGAPSPRASEEVALAVAHEQMVAYSQPPAKLHLENLRRRLWLV